MLNTTAEPDPCAALIPISISARANSIQGMPFVPSAWMENALAILYNFAEDENVVDLFVC